MTADTTSMRRQGVATWTPTFFSTVASEWTKVTSVRSTYILIGLGIILGIGMTALVAGAVGSTYDDWSEADQAEFDPVLFTVVGSIFPAILFSVFGVLVFASEYSSGMIRMTLTATPRRGRVLFAKAAVVALLTLVATAMAVVGMFVVGQAVLDAWDMPTTNLGDSDAMRTIIAMCLTAPFFPLVGLALAILLRSTAGAITAVLALIFAPSIFGGLLPRWWQENVLAFNPAAANDALALGHLDDSPWYLSAPIAAAVVIAWLALFMGVAHFVLSRRDA